MTIILITIIIYLLSMMGIGFIYSKNNRDVSDFYLGGRKLGPLVSAMSAEASDMSSWLLMGLPGVAYLTGTSETVWTSIGLVVGTYLNWLLVAKRLRVYSQKIGAITIPDFFQLRYKDKGILTCTMAIITLIFFVPYISSGFAACGKLFSLLFNYDYHISMILGAIVMIGYVYIGGFLAASITQLVQGIIMIVALAFIVLFGLSHAGGFSAVIDNAKSLPGYLELMKTHNIVTGHADNYSPITISSLISWGLGYFGMPHILVHFMAIRDTNKLKISRRVGTLWVLISMSLAIFIGVMGNMLSKNGTIKCLDVTNSETLVIQLANYMGNSGVLFAVVAGLIYSGILASTMSTVGAQLLVASSAISENIFKKVFGINMGKKGSTVVAKVTLLLIAAMSILLAWNDSSSIYRIVSFAWGGFGATFGPAMLAALFWKRSSCQGVIASIFSGGIMVFVWKFGISKLGGIFAIYELLPAFLCSMVTLILVSLITYKPDNEIENAFESVLSEL